MQKKTVTRILCAGITLTLLFAVSCGDRCNHEYTWAVQTPATCQKTGIQKGTCTICSATATAKIPLADHDFSSGSCTVCEETDPNYSNSTPNPDPNPNPTPNPDPEFNEENDLATNGYVTTRAPENYGTTADLFVQGEVVSENSTKALMGIFNNFNAPVYEGGAIWTWAEFDLTGYYEKNVDLREKFFQYDYITENCGEKSSIIVVQANGARSAEISYFNDPYADERSGVTRTSLSNGWMRVTIDLSYFFNDASLQNVSSVLIMFSNYNCIYTENSLFCIDNAFILE